MSRYLIYVGNNVSGNLKLIDKKDKEKADSDKRRIRCERMFLHGNVAMCGPYTLHHLTDGL